MLRNGNWCFNFLTESFTCGMVRCHSCAAPGRTAADARPRAVLIQRNAVAVSRQHAPISTIAASHSDDSNSAPCRRRPTCDQCGRIARAVAGLQPLRLILLGIYLVAKDRCVLTRKSGAERVLVRLCGLIGGGLYDRELRHVYAQSQRWCGFAGQPGVAWCVIDGQGRGDAPQQARKTVSRGWKAPCGVFGRGRTGYKWATGRLRGSYE